MSQMIDRYIMQIIKIILTVKIYKYYIKNIFVACLFVPKWIHKELDNQKIKFKPPWIGWETNRTLVYDVR